MGEGEGEEGQEEGGGVGVREEGGHLGLGYYMDYDITIIILKVLQFLWFWGGGLFKSGSVFEFLFGGCNLGFFVV